MLLRKWLIRFGVIVAVLIVAAVTIVLKSQRKTARNVQRLPDGSTVELKQIMFTSTNFTYTHNSRGALIETIARVVPDFLLSRFPVRISGGFGFGTTGATNLFIITEHRRPGQMSIGRLRVVSDTTNAYDACWGAHTLGSPGEVVNG